jgi:hypothetical protein
MFAQSLFYELEQFISEKEHLEIQKLKKTIFNETDAFDKILAELELKRLYSKIKIHCLEQAFDYLLVEKTKLTGADLYQLKEEIRTQLTTRSLSPM